MSEELYICQQANESCSHCPHAKPHKLITEKKDQCEETCPFASGPCKKIEEES